MIYPAFPETSEHGRLRASKAREADWKRWGPYVSDRAWGTVREDYSASGEAWEYFPHDHARSRVYRWNEDGLAGFCNRFQNVCLAIAVWNEKDPILKERLFGLTGNEGNHGEDVKEYYYYLDSTPTHSYCRMLYKYPQVAYPYTDLVHVNKRRNRSEPEYELIDALHDAFAAGRYFDVFVEYAKADQEDILCRIKAVNRGPEAAPLHILPHFWFRNTWSWGYDRPQPRLQAAGANAVYSDHRHIGERWWYVAGAAQGDEVPLLFTENETNYERLFGVENDSPYVKDAFHRFLVHGEQGAVNPAREGTKVAAHFQAQVPPGESFVVRVRFSDEQADAPFAGFAEVFDQRKEEADTFFAASLRDDASEDERRVQRQAFAGLMWTKQFYHYGVQLWLDGDPGQPPPPEQRKHGRNNDWRHLYALDVLSMPDKWEYPWFAAWDLAFHALPIAMIDPEWAKRQLILLLREWYMHPNGQIPAYEWAFSDVNPPVHAWAAWRVYKITRDLTGEADTVFLERVFHKLLLNFTWWVNRKDADGNNVFQGGFLGLDNIGVFDRSHGLPLDGHLEQADGTAWMAMYCLNMLAIALELARHDIAYEDVATKFFEHFIYISNAIYGKTRQGMSLWNEEDGFFYDVLHMPGDHYLPFKVYSFVGLIPLFAVETLEPDLLEQLPRFQRRMTWFLENRPWLVDHIASLTEPGEGERRLLSLVPLSNLRRILAKMLNPDQFLSPYGLRSLSREHAGEPYTLNMNGHAYRVGYEPDESRTGLFGGNSNWRGPVWFPLNYLMIESLQKFHHYCGAGVRVEMPTGSGREMNLGDVAGDLSRRLIRLFVRGEDGRRPFYGSVDLFQEDVHWRDHLLFYEYFHGDNGAGLGASHQTGWTALVAKLIQRSGGLGQEDT